MRHEQRELSDDYYYLTKWDVLRVAAAGLAVTFLLAVAKGQSPVQTYSPVSFEADLTAGNSIYGENNAIISDINNPGETPSHIIINRATPAYVSCIPKKVAYAANNEKDDITFEENKKLNKKTDVIISPVFVNEQEKEHEEIHPPLFVNPAYADDIIKEVTVTIADQDMKVHKIEGFNIFKNVNFDAKSLPLGDTTTECRMDTKNGHVFITDIPTTIIDSRTP